MKPSLAVLHVALDPESGVWSVIRELSRAQATSMQYRAVAIGVISSPHWPSIYANQLNEIGLPVFRFSTISAFGTAQFLWQRIRKPPIGAWAKELKRTSGADGVVLHFHNAWLSGVFLPLRKRDAGRDRTVVTFHGVSTTLQRQPVRRCLHRWMAQRTLRHSSTLTSVDRGSLALAHRLFGLSPELFTIIPNGVKIDNSLRAAPWSGKGEFTVGYVGPIAEHKGWSIVADAVLTLRAAGRKTRLLMAGTGPQQAAAERMARNHPEAIEFLGYRSSARETVMPQMHVLALMSSYEGLPMVLIEAASLGLPAVATEVGGVSEVLEGGISGLTVERTVGGLATAVETLYDEPALLQQMGLSARIIHANRFDLAKIVERYHWTYTAGNKA